MIVLENASSFQKEVCLTNKKEEMTLTKTKKHILIERTEWEKMKKNPALSETIELLEDISDLEKAKKVRGKSFSIEQYLKKRGL
ncbi:MAG: hypothetical protein NTX22_15225 [Ignavibacteriales bacterium]|nr:hypothetical protein [Ignavibacteriales bacterium]